MAVDPESAGVTFVLEDEDHTLANSLCYFLNKDPNVAFCGYSIPHPSERKVNLRVQTTGEVSAKAALKTACENLKQVCGHVHKTFKEESEQFQGGSRMET